MQSLERVGQIVGVREIKAWCGQHLLDHGHLDLIFGSLLLIEMQQGSGKGEHLSLIHFPDILAVDSSSS